MIKKLVCFFSSIALIASLCNVTVMSRSGALTGYAVDHGIYVEYKGGKNAVLNIYEGNSLVFSNSAEKETGGYFFSVPDEYTDGRVRMYCVGIGLFDVELKEYDAVSSATAADAVSSATAVSEADTPSPAPSSAPTTAATAKATEAPVKTPVPDVYEKNLDAVNAPAVIQSISEEKIDGEIYYVTRMLYQGGEITHNIRDTVNINNAPSDHSYVSGQTAAALQKGDVIHFTCNLQHLIKSIDLIYRPDFVNYVMSGGDYGTRFSRLIGRDGYSTYAFGVPVKTGKGYALLADTGGRTTEIDVSQKAFIYKISAKARHDKAELAGVGGLVIDKVYVPNTGFDDNDNVISWDDVDINAYALLRVVNGTATEAFVFEY
ncbi:MAG: hypothetical protein IJH37_10320 [Clostridia bacterium]|nr:hypothetical protein [Clostridia bacterium]